MTLRRAAGIAWLVVIGAVTLTGAPEQVGRISETAWYCLACGDAGSTDVLLNILLFLPLGLWLRAEGHSLQRAAGAVLLLTLGIELTQSFVLTGRDASLSDVLANFAGGVAGWLLLPVVMRAVSPDASFARRAAMTILTITSLIWVGTGFGLRVSLSDSSPWVGQVMRRWPGHAAYPGTFQRATLSGIDVPNDPLARIPPSLNALDLTLELTRTDVRVEGQPISLLRVVDNHRQVQLTAGIRGRDLLLESRVAASRFLLRSPVWRFEEAAITPVGQRWQYHFLRQPDRVTLQSGPAGESPNEMSIPLSLALGWAFVHPFAPPIGESAPWWSLLWLTVLLGPLGWFAGSVGLRLLLGYTVASLASLLLAARITGIPYHSDELLAALLIILAFGLWAGARARGATQTQK